MNLSSLILFNLGKANSAVCTCRFAEQTVAHILQDNPDLESARNDTWSTPSTLEDKFWDSLTSLEQTSSFLEEAGILT